LKSRGLLRHRFAGLSLLGDFQAGISKSIFHIMKGRDMQRPKLLLLEKIARQGNPLRCADSDGLDTGVGGGTGHPFGGFLHGLEDVHEGTFGLTIIGDAEDHAFHRLHHLIDLDKHPNKIFSGEETAAIGNDKWFVR
jgi:hypothetical protein